MSPIRAAVPTVKNGTTVQTQNVNDADQLTDSGYSYDATGNQTAGAGTATYNGANQMTKLVNSTGTTTYTYAGTDQNELLQESLAGGTTDTYSYGRQDSNGVPLVEAYNVSGTGTSYVVHDPTGTPIALQDATGGISYYAQDAIGSTSALVNQAGTVVGTYDYDPYGNTTATKTGGATTTRYNPYGYAGGIADPHSNLVHYGQRWYDSSTGRFTQQDSIETVADPTRANRYVYAADNPTNYTDPSGKSALECGIALVGYTAAFIGFLAAGVATGGSGFLFGVAAVGYIADGIGTAFACEDYEGSY